MQAQFSNPFNITKAADLSDDQIDGLWVDLPGGHIEIGNPASPMPMLISGGKGSGKTHLMRHYSFALQKIRAQDNLAAMITEERYLGVYFLCGGLNAGRFSGKGWAPEVWRDLFAYYLELWLAQHCLDVMDDFTRAVTELTPSRESRLSVSLLDCFDQQPKGVVNDIEGFREMLVREQRAIDVAVNNSALSGKLEVSIATSPGRLLFGIPQAFWREMPEWKTTLVVYLIDEFENLTPDQQSYIHTLIRERKDPCTFKIGGRLYGFKTTTTFSAGEENKEGSEFERLSLDARLRKTHSEYRAFATRLCLRRLAYHGYPVPPTASLDADEKASETFLSQHFFEYGDDPMVDDEAREVVGNRAPNDRPYLVRLRKHLLERPASHSLATASPTEIDRVISVLQCPEHPLAEKLNCFLFYRSWDKGHDLTDAATVIAGDCTRYINGQAADKDYGETLSHFKSDLLAQLYRDCGKRYTNLGIDSFVSMSEGLPRNLLIILKLIFKWAVFYGEQPFRGGKVTVRAQRAGIVEAAEWFFEDARGPGADGQLTRNGVAKMARLLREIRFSDKPSECSLCTFSVDYDRCALQTRRLLDLAEQWSFLIRVQAGAKDKNSKRVDRKYQINGMLAPHWDLPISRRGTLQLSPGEVDIIFDAESTEFEDLVDVRVKRMMAPHFGKKDTTNKRSRTEPSQGSMFDSE